jgi:ABC-2 type transport system permease protein
VFAEWNPVSAVTQAARQLSGNIPEGIATPAGCAMHHPIICTVLWSAGIILLFVPLSNRQYRHAISR